MWDLGPNVVAVILAVLNLVQLVVAARLAAGDRRSVRRQLTKGGTRG